MRTASDKWYRMTDHKITHTLIFKMCNPSVICTHTHTHTHTMSEEDWGINKAEWTRTEDNEKEEFFVSRTCLQSYLLHTSNAETWVWYVYNSDRGDLHCRIYTALTVGTTISAYAYPVAGVTIRHGWQNKRNNSWTDVTTARRTFVFVWAS